MKSPSSVNAFTVATAPPFCVEVGRITEHRGRLLLTKLHGSGRILLVWVSSVAGLFRSGKVSPVTGSTTPAKGWATALAPLSRSEERRVGKECRSRGWRYNRIKRDNESEVG